MKKPEQMYHITFLVEAQKRSETLNRLQDSGVCQIDFSSERTSAPPDDTTLHALRERIRKLRRSLDAPSAKKRIKQPRALRLSTIKKKVDVIESELDSITGRQQRMAGRVEELETTISRLERLVQLPLGLIRENRQTYDHVLAVIPENRLPSLEKRSDSKRLLCHQRYSDDELFVCELHDNNGQSVLKDLPEATIITPPQLDGLTSEELSSHRERLSRAKRELEHLNKTLQRLGDENATALELYERILSDAIDHENASRSLSTSEFFTTGTAWVAHSDYDRFTEVLHAVSRSPLILAVKRDDAPSKFDNNKYVSAYQEITRLYSVPKYAHFDPTILIAIFFPLIFGIMYSDAVYGLIIAFIAIYLFRKKDRSTRSYATILSSCAVVTIIAGVLTGSYFGNVLETVGIDVFSILSLMTDIIPLVVLSLSIGIIHIGTGLISGFHERVLRGRVLEAVSEQGVWILFLIGAIIAVTLPEMMTSAISLMIASLLIKAGFVYEEQGSVSAILSIFDVSKFAGDIASYVRIMALAIGTAGIAMAVNVMTGIAFEYIPTFGVVLAVLIFIVGHVFNMLISGLGAFIHTLRLHFLEHFSRYYIGDGREYEPFSKRASTRLQQD